MERNEIGQKLTEFVSYCTTSGDLIHGTMQPWAPCNPHAPKSLSRSWPSCCTDLGSLGFEVPVRPLQRHGEGDACE